MNGLEYYKYCFKHYKRGQIKGEYTPNYLSYDLLNNSSSGKVKERIESHNPEVKLITCLRNPVERTYSHYLFDYYAGLITRPLGKDLEEFNIYIKNSLYYEGLSDFYKYFPKKNILVLIYEDIQRDPVKFIQNIYDFLGVDSTFIPPSINVKTNIALQKRTRVPFVNQMISHTKYLIKQSDSKVGKFLYSILKYTNLYKVAFLLMRLNTNYQLSKTDKIKKQQTKRPISPELRAYLNNIFEDDIRNLEKLIGKDLSFWK